MSNFNPEGLSVFAPFSFEFYLNYEVNIEIQGLSRCVRTLDSCVDWSFDNLPGIHTIPGFKPLRLVNGFIIRK